MSNPILVTLADVVPLLEKLAPTIATAVGGPLAGTPVTFLEKALGLAPGAGAQSVATAMSSATPVQLVAIKKADNDFAEQMRELDISLETLGDDNRASARSREKANRDRTPAVLAYALTVGLFGFVVLLLTVKDIPPSSAQALNLTLGSIGTAWVAMISYYFGSSRGSQAKDMMLFNSTPVAVGAK